MKIYKFLALSTAAIVALNMPAHANDRAHFTSHHLVPEKPYADYVQQLPAERKLEVREYLDYEEREPCQFYQPIPEGFVKDGCDIVREGQERPMEIRAVTINRNVIADYEVNFAFDSAELRPKATNTINRVANEINTYKPDEVTVAGHTDRAGPADYNLKLSRARAEAVSDALTSKGVRNRILDEKAFGERKLEVPTADGVRNAANRRVEIQFIK